jgi:predicted NodU family carbamoyl transferase
MKNSSDTIGNRTRGLPVCSVVNLQCAKYYYDDRIKEDYMSMTVVCKTQRRHERTLHTCRRQKLKKKSILKTYALLASKYIFGSSESLLASGGLRSKTF